jgi:hypothetical protein
MNYEPGMFETKGYEGKVPTHILENLVAWGKKQHRVGDFLTAVLSNNLFEAYKRADEESAAAMRDIIKFIYNRLPNSCWGSPQAVHDWIASENFGRV